MKLSALLLAASLSAPALAQAPALEVGQPYPDLRLPTIDGERTLSIRDLVGKPVLLIEFASW